jgi:lysyl-tRNA synthetase class 1
MPYQVPFRHLCNLIQIAGGDIEKAIAEIQRSANASTGAPVAEVTLKDEQIPALKARAVCAKYWVENCAPEEFRFSLRTAGEKALLSETETRAVRMLRDDVVAHIETFGDDKSCAEAVYAVAEKAGLEGKALFRAAYQALIGKDQGPRLANFLRSIQKEELVNILAAY